MGYPTQFLKFCVVGAIGGVINLELLFVFTEVFHIWYMVSASGAFTIAVVHNFFLNKYWTFQNKAPEIRKQFSLFFVVSVTSLLVNVTVLYVLVELFEMWYMTAEIMAILTATGSNYWGNKKLTFR